MGGGGELVLVGRMGVGGEGVELVVQVGIREGVTSGLHPDPLLWKLM